MMMRKLGVLGAERRTKILDILRQEGSIKISDLAELFNDINISTLRRDLNGLEKEGLLKKVYGGAILQEERIPELSLLKKKVSFIEQKKRIADRAVQMIENGDTISLDPGTTTMEIARCLKTKQALTVVTNAINIAYELSYCRGITVNLTGGILRNFYSLHGPLAEQSISNMFVSKAFLGTSGLSISKGLTDPCLLSAQIKSSMINSANELIIVTDHSKIGKIEFASVASVEVINKLIVDDGISPEDVKAFEEKGIEVIIC